MSKEHIDFVGAIVWYVGRVLAVLFVAIRLVSYIDGLERRGQTQHEQMMREHAAFMQQHDRMMRQHDAQAADHRAILQRLGH